MASDVKWIKIITDIFDDEKILMIESMPAADSIIVIWFKLLTFAGKQNNDGVFMMSNRIAYTDEMLASIFRRDVNIVRLALGVFEQYGMIEVIEDVITIPNWGKHQTLDAYEKKKERDRIRIARKRAEQKALITMSPDTSPDTSPVVAFSEKDIDIERDKDKEKEIISCSDKPVSVSKKPVKHKYGEYNHVLLTDPEYEKLCKDFGEDIAKRAITYLDEAIEMKGYKYKSHNLAIRKWVIDAVKKQKVTQNTGYGTQDLNDLDEFFQ